MVYLQSSFGKQLAVASAKMALDDAGWRWMMLDGVSFCGFNGGFRYRVPKS